MASQYIKIFNDTVLKQSILQGYESQRQNPNLGKFTSGELAFTRDTGRVFVGNYTDNPTNDDLKTVDGGLLIGNKYLGIIDSRPFDYVGDTSLGGLSYEQPNKEEEALFVNNPRVKKDGKTNDWKNDPSFNPTYGTYNGDYLYDVWRNALIIFDNNIKPNSNTIKVTNPFLDNEQVYDELGNEISKTGTIRTPIEDWTNNDSMKEYPIYGNGYVLLRIIEPDGETIKFKSRGKISTTTTEDICNWTHNILEVQFTPNNLINALDENFFEIIQNDGKSYVTLKNEKFSSSYITDLPSIINFSSSSNEKITYDFVTSLAPSFNDDDNNKNFILGYTYNKTSDNNNITFKKFNADELCEILNVQEIIGKQEQITITVGDNLDVDFNGSNYHITLNLSKEESNKGTDDPWECGIDGAYHGTGKYINGTLSEVNNYAPTFRETTNEDESKTSAEENKDNFKKIINKFIANDIVDDYWCCNVGLNYLRTPITLSSYNSSIDKVLNGGLRVIPDHAESIILLVTTTSTSAQISVNGCNTPIFKTSQEDFTTTVEIPLIPKTTKEVIQQEEPQLVDYTTTKEYNFTATGCTIKLLGYRL